MSIVHSPMYNNDHFKPAHSRSRSYNEVLSQFLSAAEPLQSKPSSPSRATYIKKRSYSDLIKESPSLSEVNDAKRSRTAPPSPPYESEYVLKRSLLWKNIDVRSQSLSPPKKLFQAQPLSPRDSPVTSPVVKKLEPASDILASTLAPSGQTVQNVQLQNVQLHHKVQNVPNVSVKTPLASPAAVAAAVASSKASSSLKLPSLSSALRSTPMSGNKLNPIAPTVSLDYFDTYKPNDENWRYELVDSITKSSKHSNSSFSLDKYSYLNRYDQLLQQRSNTSYRPSFNSKISPKILHPHVSQSHYDYPRSQDRTKSYSAKKINFPYESNYTYLNKTYLTDVERYPEYLELAQSLILLSQLDQLLYLYSEPAIAQQYDDHMPSSPTSQSSGSPILSGVTAATAPVAVSSFVHSSISAPALAPAAVVSRLAHMHSYNPYMNFEVPMSGSIPLVPVQVHHQPVQIQALAGPVDVVGPTTPKKQHQHHPLTPPSSKSKSGGSDAAKSPLKSSQVNVRVCISCGSDQSPCWRPSWSIKEGQLCNSCGLRYKKTAARCLNQECKKIPAKGEWSLMQSKGRRVFEDGLEGYGCLDCAHRVEVRK